MTRSCLRVVFFTLLFFSLHAAAINCGAERARVKNLHDHFAVDVFEDPKLPTNISIASLVALPGHSKHELLHLDSTRIAPTETTVYRVHANIIGFKLEDDGDIHVVVQDEDGRTMIVELVNPACVPTHYAGVLREVRAQFIAHLGRPTATFKRLYRPQHAIFIGIGFFDFTHGQTGHAENGIELHPIIQIEFVDLYALPAALP